MPRNKNRIYIAMYERAGRGDFHSALLFTPKKAEPDSVWRLHAMNKPNLQYPVTQQEWQYDPLKVIGRTSRLCALIVIGKTQMSAEEVRDLLREVPIIQDDPTWLCHSWTRGATELLTSRGVIAPLPLPFSDLFAVGEKMGTAFLQIEQIERWKVPIPTCNAAGEKIASEL